jgi:hypothetical protein
VKDKTRHSLTKGDTGSQASSLAENADARVALTFDAAEFSHFLKDTDWTEAQKREFTEALWQIVVNFVDLGFSLHPVQQVIDPTKTLEGDGPSVVPSNNITSQPETKTVSCSQEHKAARMDS